MTTHLIPATETKRTDWATVCGHAAVYILGAVFVGLIVVACEVVRLQRESINAMDRLNQRMNADSRLIQIAILTVDPERKSDIDQIIRDHQQGTAAGSPRTP